MAYRAIFCSITLLMLAGCDLMGGYGVIRITTPELPGELDSVFAGVEYQIEIRGVYAGTAQGSTTTAIRVRKGTPFSVVAYPSIRDRDGALRRVLRPAGAIAGIHGFEGEAALQWEDGVAATVASRLERANVPLDGINVNRLRHDIRERAGERQWDIDIEGTVRELASGAMHVRKLSPVAGSGLEATVPDGRWVRGDALRPEHYSSVDQRLVLSDLSPGSHEFFHADGIAAIHITVTEGGETGWIVKEWLP